MSALTARGSTRRWRRIRAAVLQRDGWQCQAPGQVVGRIGAWAAALAPSTWPRNAEGRALVCGAYADTADHVVRRHDSGTDDLRNLRALCTKHNSGRGERTDAELAAADLEQQQPAPARRTRWSW
ncbi:hypothetical protein GCM10027425_09170 [Alteromonas gracilis]